MKTCRRIHIPLLLLVAAVAFADPAPKMLISAQTHDGRVRTDATFFVQPNASAAATLQTQSCVGPVPFSPVIQPGGAIVLRDFVNQWTCSLLPEFTLIPAPTNLESEVEITFSQPTNFSFRTGPIGAIDIDHPATVTPVVSDDVDWTIVTVLPTNTATLLLSLNGGKEQACAVAPPVTQCVVSDHGAGTLRVRVAPCAVGPCPAASPIYGLVTDGRRDGVASLTAHSF